MKTPLLTPILTVSLFAASATPVAAYSQNTVINPLYGPYYRQMASTTSTGIPAAKGHQSYYGIPEAGVNLLPLNRRDSILQELAQRVINLQTLRNRTGITPEYTREKNIYERLLTRVGSPDVEHYRAPQEAPTRSVWRNGQLVSVPRLTPADIHEAVDAYEYERAVRTSPEDECKRFSGTREAICRYQQRVDDRINN
ncbi:MAG: hypothetical protein KC680_00550 [Candidatus Peregrinibacteria bacterium]|nr:hypothetical protein [Candidatus Peregrinibacteria bacterium]MCB9807853.1 hypothetical protein [Candidatus Peribacteria bacterium]